MNFGPYGPEHPDVTYVPHLYPEALFDTGEVTLNYAVTGSDSKPALLLVPPQVTSWWGYEQAMELGPPPSTTESAIRDRARSRSRRDRSSGQPQGRHDVRAGSISPDFSEQHEGA